jgi:putative Ca2+/H+ antiporter (TMEM165/GDT1 family)
LLLASYVVVFIAELLGDKTLYTLGTLATRRRLLPLVCGSAAAFALKMLAAVLFGGFLQHLPLALRAGLSALTFAGLAIALWRGKQEERNQREPGETRWLGGAITAFLAIFLTEWGDPGQLAAVALVGRFHLPWIVWLGGTLALVTKGVLAMTLGVSLRRWVPDRALRYGGALLCLALSLVSILPVDL